MVHTGVKVDLAKLKLHTPPNMASQVPTPFHNITMSQVHVPSHWPISQYTHFFNMPSDVFAQYVGSNVIVGVCYSCLM